MTQSKSISYSVYSDPDFVKKYAESIQDNPWNTYYQRPSTLSLLPDIKGKKVLDIGCGPGITTLELLNRGAEVVGVDYSPAMIAVAQSRVGDRARIQLADLNEGLAMFSHAQFDIAYSSLTIHYVDDLNVLFSELARILKRDGLLIFSTDHPENPDFKDNPITEKRISKVLWESLDVSMDVIERPWKDTLSTIEQSGFQIEKIIDAQPTQECKTRFPEEYNYLTQHQHFICVRAIKHSPI